LHEHADQVLTFMSSSIKDVSDIVAGNLSHCDSEQIAAFQRYNVEPYYAPIMRYGSMDSVVVVARRESEVIYWDDVEEGFNVLPLAHDGAILHHWCNQDDLGLALNSWIDGRSPTAKCGPAAPIPR